MSNRNKLNIKEKGFIYLENDVKLLNVYFIHNLNINLLLINALLIDK